MAMTCDVPTCPAVPEFGKALCPLHTRARLAAALGITGNAAGKGAKTCLFCQRTFKSLDWVLLSRVRLAPTTATGRPRKGDVEGYVHAACAPRLPKLSKRKQREEPKPLLAWLDDAPVIVGPD